MTDRPLLELAALISKLFVVTMSIAALLGTVALLTVALL